MRFVLTAGLAASMITAALAQPAPKPQMGDSMPMKMMMPEASDSASTKEYKASMMRMMQAMPSKFTGDADVDFMMQTKAHHQGTIDMAKVVLANGKDPTVKKLATEIVSAQENEIKLLLLRRAGELVRDFPESDDLAIDVAQRVLKLAPGDEAAREGLVRRLLARGRHKDVADVFEQALKREPAPTPEEALLLREQLVDLCLGALKDVTRALVHLDGVLELAPTHPSALAAAEGLLENRAHAPRAAAALSDAYERSGRTDRAIAMLSFELKTVRGPRRVEVQRRLGILRQDVLSDPAGALELLGPVVAGNPGDDDLRSRFVTLSLGLNQPEQAARLLSRALAASKDNGVRARVGADVGLVYLKSGDVKRAKVSFQQVLDLGERGNASLVAARELCELCTESAELKQLLSALTLVVELEPEREAKQAAARRLARLCDGEAKDVERSIVAWRALIGSPWTDEAIRRLESLFRETKDEDGLAEVLFQRAERTKDPEEARALSRRVPRLCHRQGRRHGRRGYRAAGARCRHHPAPRQDRLDHQQRQAGSGHPRRVRFARRLCLALRA